MTSFQASFEARNETRRAAANVWPVETIERELQVPGTDAKYGHRHMIITIGILAYNEVARIGNVIGDLKRQTLLLNPRRSIFVQIHIVANGCTDGTADFARSALTDIQANNVQSFVHEIPQPGKSNAWNQLIHSIAAPNTDFIYLLDADIRIPSEQHLELVLDRLIETDSASVAIDEPISDISIRPPRSLIERLINAGGGTAYDTKTTICGQFYCARFSVLKKITMPIGLPGEDGFLRAMIVTSNFAAPADPDRVVFVEGARHTFEAERTFQGLFRHNIRLAIGTALNVLLFEHFHELRRTNQNICQYISERNTKDPNWINQLAKSRLETRYFLFNSDFVLNRFKRLSTLAFFGRIRKAPICLLGTLFDVSLLIVANHLMRKGTGAGFW